MLYGGKLVCPRCGRELVGVFLHYGSKWPCAECADDKEEPAYEVESVEIGGWRSEIKLKEFPGKKFNSVFFRRVS